jgi:hypothetical protein
VAAAVYLHRKRSVPSGCARLFQRPLDEPVLRGVWFAALLRLAAALNKTTTLCVWSASRPPRMLYGDARGAGRTSQGAPRRRPFLPVARLAACLIMGGS